MPKPKKKSKKPIRNRGPLDLDDNAGENDRSEIVAEVVDAVMETPALQAIIEMAENDNLRRDEDEERELLKARRDEEREELKMKLQEEEDEEEKEKLQMRLQEMDDEDKEGDEPDQAQLRNARRETLQSRLRARRGRQDRLSRKGLDRDQRLGVRRLEAKLADQNRQIRALRTENQEKYRRAELEKVSMSLVMDVDKEVKRCSLMTDKQFQGHLDLIVDNFAPKAVGLRPFPQDDNVIAPPAREDDKIRNDRDFSERVKKISLARQAKGERVNFNQVKAELLAEESKGSGGQQTASVS